MSYIYILLFFLGYAIAQESNNPQNNTYYVIEEEFNDLKNWENFSFSGNKNPTYYAIIEDSINTYLKIVSQSSASGIIHATAFDPNQYPVLRWRWKIKNIIPDADGKTKSGDDQLNKWLSYDINIVDLFSKIYNRSCPRSAKLAIMSDTDNTESRTEAILDFIRIGIN